MIEIVRANALHMDVRKEMSRIFVEGFHQWLKYFSKEKQPLVDVMEHAFNLDVFYFARVDGQMAGFTACSDGTVPTLRLEEAPFLQHLGEEMGSIAYSMLKGEFEEKQYPFPIVPGMGVVEFVATASEHRGKGVASAVIRHILANTPYDQYVLEVADTNQGAVRLYQKLGFQEFQRVKEPNSEQSGVNYLVYMRYDR